MVTLSRTSEAVVVLMPIIALMLMVSFSPPQMKSISYETVGGELSQTNYLMIFLGVPALIILGILGALIILGIIRTKFKTDTNKSA